MTTSITTKKTSFYDPCNYHLAHQALSRKKQNKKNCGTSKKFKKTSASFFASFSCEPFVSKQLLAKQGRHVSNRSQWKQGRYIAILRDIDRRHGLSEDGIRRKDKI